MPKLVWRARAREDAQDIIGYISDRNPVAAERLGDLFEHVAERLADHPYVHRPGRIPGTREAIVHPNYILVYRVTADTVEVLTVIHSRRQYP